MITRLRLALLATVYRRIAFVLASRKSEPVTSIGGRPVFHFTILLLPRTNMKHAIPFRYGEHLEHPGDVFGMAKIVRAWEIGTIKALHIIGRVDILVR